MSDPESLRVAKTPRKAQTGQYSLSSANSVPHTEQARLPSTFATVSSSKLEFYSIWAPMACRKIADTRASLFWLNGQNENNRENQARSCNELVKGLRTTN